MLVRKAVVRSILFVLCGIVCGANLFGQGGPGKDSTPPTQPIQDNTILIDDTARGEQIINRVTSVEQTDDVRQDLYKKLERYLSGSKFVGRFTMTGKEDQAPAAEEYHILSAKKAVEGDKWLLKVRIKYGGKDLTVPLPPMDIKWAGETPVITVDQMTIPGMGTFDARVLIRKGKYSGTWSHDDVGGHLFGTIEKGAAEEKSGDAEKKN